MMTRRLLCLHGWPALEIRHMKELHLLDNVLFHDNHKIPVSRQKMYSNFLLSFPSKRWVSFTTTTTTRVLPQELRRYEGMHSQIVRDY